jgi:cytochrome c553
MKKLVMLAGALAIGMAPMGARAAGDAAAGQTKAAACGGCHGVRGEGMATNPKIAGMAEDAFVKALAEYKDGTRPNPIMKSFAAGLSDQDMADLAAFYANQ